MSASPSAHAPVPLATPASPVLPSSGPESAGRGSPPEPGSESFLGWTLRARVVGDRVIAKATCPADGRVLSSGPQPTRAHAFGALRALIASEADCA